MSKTGLGLFILLSAAACSRTHQESAVPATPTPGHAPAAPGSLPGALAKSSCTVDAECPGDKLCRPSDGACVPRYPNRMLVASRDTGISGQQCELAHAFFAFDSTELTEETRRWLDHNARCLKVLRMDSLVIEGHADARGDTAYNQDLSRRRGEAVRDYLRQQGVAVPMAVRPAGPDYATSYHPSGPSEESHAWARRVEILAK